MLGFRLDSQESEGPILEAHTEAATWNGWSVPVVTAKQVRQYVYEMRRNDPNGIYPVVTVRGDRLILSEEGAEDGDDFSDDFPSAGIRVAATGEGLYSLIGWTWGPAN